VPTVQGVRVESATDPGKPGGPGGPGPVPEYLADGRPGAAASKDAVRAFLAGAEGGEPAAEAVTERTYVQVRQSAGALQVESCDRVRDNLVLHRSVFPS
jgi:hypothetical protein